MAIVIKINNVDKTDAIVRRSLRIENIMTRQIDKCKFTLRRFGTKHTYTPAIGREVIVELGGTKIFGGNITKVNQKSKDYKIIEYEIECHDYGRLLDRYLVNDSFENQSIADIIDYIVADKGLDDAGFTTNSIEGTKVVAYIAFKYEPFSSVLQQLADLINYDWYVDYNKDIHFFSKTKSSASFDVQDNLGNFIWKSLIIRRDNSQVKNVIYVRGGEYLGSSFTSEFISDASQNVWTLPYKYDTLKVNVTGEIWGGGIDGVDNEAAFDYVWNNEEKFIKFRSDRIPRNTSSIKVSGEPYLPVIVKMKDPVSIAAMISAEGGTGEYEHVIIDKSIDSREGARERARAEMESYASTLSQGEFSTYKTGLKAGQRIRINSVAHNIDEYFIINKVVYQPWTEEEFAYHISLVTTKTFGIIDFLRDLLVKEKKKIVINENEILDIVEAIDESLSITEVITRVTEKDIEETVNLGEVITDDPFGAGIGPEWCLAVATLTSSLDRHRDMYLDISSYLATITGGFPYPS